MDACHRNAGLLHPTNAHSVVNLRHLLGKQKIVRSDRINIIIEIIFSNKTQSANIRCNSNQRFLSRITGPQIKSHPKLGSPLTILKKDIEVVTTAVPANISLCMRTSTLFSLIIEIDPESVASQWAVAC